MGRRHRGKRMMDMVISPMTPVFDEYGGVRDVYLTVARTHDPEIVRAIVEHPDIMPMVWDGPGRPPIPMVSSVYHLAARIDGELAGLITFVPINSVTWNPHVNMLVRGRGIGTEVVKRGISWMFENTDCIKIVAFPPAYNRAMIRVFEKSGFLLEGRSPKSFKFNNTVFDRLLMGIGKG